jgi:hypothetical protein
MHRFDLILCNAASTKKDDVIRVYDTDTRDLYMVVMKPADFQGTYYKGYLTHERLLGHISNILESLQYDMDPWEHVQLSPALTPSIMYHISDMNDSNVRDLILDMVRDVLRFDCERVTR